MASAQVRAGPPECGLHLRNRASLAMLAVGWAVPRVGRRRRDSCAVCESHLRVAPPSVAWSACPTLHQLSASLLPFQRDSSDQRERVVTNRAAARSRCGPAALHQLSASLLLFQRDSSDQRERVVTNRAAARIGCGPAALREIAFFSACNIHAFSTLSLVDGKNVLTYPNETKGKWP